VQALGRREIRLEQGRVTANDAALADPAAEEHITIHGPTVHGFAHR
jgi:hypothetical protein